MHHRSIIIFRIYLKLTIRVWVSEASVDIVPFNHQVFKVVNLTFEWRNCSNISGWNKMCIVEELSKQIFWKVWNFSFWISLLLKILKMERSLSQSYFPEGSFIHVFACRFVGVCICECMCMCVRVGWMKWDGTGNLPWDQFFRG